MSLLTPPILTPVKARTYAMVEAYKLQALCSMYPELTPALTPIIKFCEKARRKFQTDPQYAPYKEGGHSYDSFMYGASVFNNALLKEATALVPGGLPAGALDGLTPPVDNTARIEEIDFELAALRKQVSSLREERAVLKAQSGLIFDAANVEYMRKYMQRRREQKRGEKVDV